MKKTHLILLTLLIASFLLIPPVYSAKGGTPFNELWDALNDLVARVTGLETSGPFDHPDYDSGWVPIPLGWTYLQHDLGTTDVYVYIIGRNGDYTHQFSYGGDWVRNKDSILSSYGVYWQCYLNRLKITRWMDDTEWQEVRVLLWKLPDPPA